MSLQSVVACRSVKDFSDPVLDLIERTYTESFPEVERRDFSLVRNLVRVASFTDAWIETTLQRRV